MISIEKLIVLLNVCKEDIRIRGSSSKPISIPFYTNTDKDKDKDKNKDKNFTFDNTKYELLYKKDDVRRKSNRINTTISQRIQGKEHIMLHHPCN